MTRASTDLTGKASPLRFYAPRMRGGRARCADQLPLAVSQVARRSAINEASRTTRTQVSRSKVIHASESGESESLALANDPSRQATPLRQSAASCRVMHRRVPWRGVPLPRLEAFAAWPGERVLPSCVRPAALLGFLFCETLNTTGLRTSPKLLLARLMPTYLPWA